MNFRGRVCEPKIYFLYFVTGGRRLCWNMWTINTGFGHLYFLICLTVCKSPSEENSTSLKKTLTSRAPHDTLQETIAFENKRKSLLVIQIKLNQTIWNPYVVARRALRFKRGQRKCSLHWRPNLADQNKQQPLKINIRVTYHTFLSVWNKPLIDTCQHCSTNRANQALRFAGERRFSKSRGLSASVSFLPLPLPPLSFFGSCFISRTVKTENPVPRSS